MKRAWVAGAALAALGTAGLRAETLPVEGLYAAGADAPSRVRAIAIAGFAGRGGERVAFAIDSALRGAVVEGRPYFQLTMSDSLFGDAYRYDRDADPAARRGGADAVMRGIADVEVRDIDSGQKEIEECAVRDNRGKCTEKKKVFVPCRARNVTLRGEVRLVARDGELLYAKGDAITLQRRFCRDEQVVPSVDEMVAEMAGRFAGMVRGDLAPTYRAEDIRLLESRRGIAKSDHEAFRAALRLTRTDVAAACDGFAALEANNPRDITVLFNIGLCFESADNLERAAEIYQNVLSINPRKIEPEQGLGRIASRVRAQGQLGLRGQADAR
jgi:tetratricopeptide (TPR) repeat protein